MGTTSQVCYYKAVMYQEGARDTFTHNGREYSLNKLLILTNNLPVKEFLVDELVWIFKYSRRLIDGTMVCSSCLGNEVGWHEKRVENCDLTVPIIVTIHDDRLVVLDGLHRLEKAVKLNLTKIPGRMVVENLLQDCL